MCSLVGQGQGTKIWRRYIFLAKSHLTCRNDLHAECRIHVDKCVVKAIMNIMMFVFMLRRGGAGGGAGGGVLRIMRGSSHHQQLSSGVTLPPRTAASQHRSTSHRSIAASLLGHCTVSLNRCKGCTNQVTTLFSPQIQWSPNSLNIKVSTKFGGNIFSILGEVLAFTATV